MYHSINSEVDLEESFLNIKVVPRKGFPKKYTNQQQFSWNKGQKFQQKICHAQKQQVTQQKKAEQSGKFQHDQQQNKCKQNQQSRRSLQYCQKKAQQSQCQQLGSNIQQNQKQQQPVQKLKQKSQSNFQQNQHQEQRQQSHSQWQQNQQQCWDSEEPPEQQQPFETQPCYNSQSLCTQRCPSFQNRSIYDLPIPSSSEQQQLKSREYVQEKFDDSKLHRYKQCSIPLPSQYDYLFSTNSNADSIGANLLLPGRCSCDCAATRHKLIGSCTACGRIQCAQEGTGPCLFCSRPPGLSRPVSGLSRTGAGRGLRPLVASSPRLVFQPPSPPSSLSSTVATASSLRMLRRLSLRLQDGHLLRLRDEGLCLRSWEPWASMLLRPSRPFFESGELPGSAWTLHRGCLWIAVPSDRQQASLPPSRSSSSSTAASASPQLLLLGCVQLDDVLSLEQHSRQTVEELCPQQAMFFRMPADSRLHGGRCILLCSHPRRLSSANVLTVPAGAVNLAEQNLLRGGLFKLDRSLHQKAQSLLS